MPNNDDDDDDDSTGSFIPFLACTTRSGAECPDVKNYKWQLNHVWHSMLYSCTRMTTVGVKWLINFYMM